MKYTERMKDKGNQMGYGKYAYVYSFDAINKTLCFIYSIYYFVLDQQQQQKIEGNNCSDVAFFYFCFFFFLLS